MKIGLFTDCYLPTKNGVSTSLLQVKEELEKRGHRVRVFTVKTPGYTEPDPSVHAIPSLPFNPRIEIRLGLVNQREIERVVKGEALELLHTHTEFSLGWAAKRAAHSCHLPLIHTAHTMYEHYRHYLPFGRVISRRMLHRIQARFLRHYRCLVCPSPKALRYYRSFLPHLTSVVIGNGVSKARFQENSLSPHGQKQLCAALNIRQDDRLLLYVGRIAREKRIMELFYATLPLLQASPAYKLVCVGDGHKLEELRRVAARHHVARQILLTGYVEWSQMSALYATADLFVTASLSENHPMTLIEAVMCGLPLIVRNDESMTRIVRHGENGYLTDSDSDIAERAAELLQDDAKRRLFGKQSLKIAQHFSVENHVDRLEALYKQTLNS